MLHMIDEDLGDSGYDWLDHGEFHAAVERRLAAEDAMDEARPADFLEDDQ